MQLSKPLTYLNGVGPQVAQRLARLGLTHIEDLLFHLPLRYEDRTRIQAIAELREGEEAVIEAEVEAAEIKTGRRRTLLVVIRDTSGAMMLRFFHFSSLQQRQLVPGARVRCFGEVRAGYHCLELIHPEYRQVDENSPPPVADSLTPVYPSTDGLHQAVLRKLSEQALGYPFSDHLPAQLQQHFGFPDLVSALKILHRPPPGVDTAALLAGTHPAQQRLAFEELLAHHLSLRLLRHHTRQRQAPSLAVSRRLLPSFLAALPFQLTGAQQRVWTEIQADLVQANPMQRLVQGDVGSGKTVVAALAALQALEAGYQVAVMAPTELLAEQHLQTFQRWLTPLGVNPAWLSGSLARKPREQVLAQLHSGACQLLIGTHALFQAQVEFAHLGLVIIDEQHRFGVHQRLALRDKGSQGNLVPHQLIMTATPIPRTLAMTAYADLDTSVIDELPPGRTPVTTVVVADSRRDDVIKRVAEACRAGRQAYWVCPLIEESDVLESQAAEDTAARLHQDLPGLRIGLAHGRLKTKDKAAVMAAFKAGEVDLLVATTVIEVGVDVPNASLMIIDNAERLGLAQLHQLRGRVGRGALDSFCVLLYQPPLSEASRARLQALRETQDGFEIARRDLELRGPGEFLGTRQTGLTQLRIADLQRDRALLAEIPACADWLLRAHPEQAQALVSRWVKQRVEYGAV